LFVGASYESGYEKNGALGVYLNPATLSVQGLDLHAGYELELKPLVLYVKAGLGLYHYVQTIRNNPFTEAYKVDQTKATAVFGAGFKLFPAKFLFLSGEAKYIPLKVRPYDYDVDLGGWRFLAGLGVSFEL
jgi:hypothetical protein